MLIDELKEISNSKSIGIFGAGLSGIAARNLLESMKLKCIVYDENNESYGYFTEADIKKHSLIICSPGFLPGHKWVTLARKHSIGCVSEVDFAYMFMKKYRGKVVAVTGTNGKTTTTEFLTFLLKNAGYQALACGNIGRPISDVILTEDLTTHDHIICEISSFQAAMVSLFSPNILIWTNFYPNHLNKHDTIDEYFNCKANLVKMLKSDQFFCGESVMSFARKKNAQVGKKFSSATECIYGNHHDSIVAGTAMEMAPNRENFAISAEFCKKNNIPFEKSIVEKFKPSKYRLEFVCKKYGKFFWNDSKSTTFSSLDAALNNFNNKVIWIGGGEFKGGYLEDILRIIRDKIECALLIGETGKQLCEVLEKNNIAHKYSFTVDRAVKDSVQQTSDTVLFSPAFASFDQFKDYRERGKFFEKCILDLKI